MSDYFRARQIKPDYHSRWFRGVVTGGAFMGVLLLAAAAFVFSYAGMRETAISAGVSPAHAGLFPLILDATLAVACLSALGLRGATWWLQAFAWLTVLVLLAGLAMAQALRAAGGSLPPKPAAAAVAAIPWISLLLGFALALSMLSHLRAVRSLSLLREHDAWLWEAGEGTDSHGPASGIQAAGWQTDADPGWEPEIPAVRLIPPPAPAEHSDSTGPAPSVSLPAT